MLAEEFGCPLIAKVHGSDINELLREPRLRQQICSAFGQAHAVIAVSGALRDRMVEAGISANKIIVQHNAVDGARFTIRDRSEANPAPCLSEAGRRLVYVGRLGREKGVDLLIDAFARMPAEFSDTRLFIVGDGAERDRLQAQSDASGAGGRISFQGSRPHSEIPAWLAAADVLCLPSRREGCPNVVLEALASGRPVVACGVGGVPEMLSERNGIVVEPENSEALARGIQQALSRTWDAIDLRASVKHLSWSDVAGSIADVIDSAIAAPLRPQRQV